MAHDAYRKMNVEEAKLFLLSPPPPPPRQPGAGPALKPGIALLAAGAAVAGFLLSNPGRVRRLARPAKKLLRSPMAKRAAVTFLSALAAKKTAV
jgi:hypothetical protein